MLIALRMLDPLAGSPQLLQSGPMTAREFTLMWVATQRASLGQASSSGMVQTIASAYSVGKEQKNPQVN